MQFFCISSYLCLLRRIQLQHEIKLHLFILHLSPLLSVLIFTFVLQTDGTAAAAVGFQKGSHVGGWRSGENTGDFQTMDLLILYFVTNAGSQLD